MLDAFDLGDLTEVEIVLQFGPDGPSQDQKFADDVDGDEGRKGSDHVGCQPVVGEGFFRRFVMLEISQLKYLFKNVQWQMWFFLNNLPNHLNDLALEHFIVVVEPLDQKL